MHESNGFDLVRLDAFRSIIKSINSTAALPSQVFEGSWAQFFFCESDRIFAPCFAEIAIELLRAGGSNSCCLLNFDLTPEIQYESAATLFLEEGVSENDYASCLRKGGSSSGWLYGMHRYGCAPDVGGWCIYCEKVNDLAVIAIRDPGDAEKFAGPLERLYAHSIDDFLKMGSSAPVPFSQLIESWRSGLLQNYSKRPS